MKLFLDSSAYAKRFIEEKGSQQVEDLCAEASELGMSVLCVPEVISALNRRLREKKITRQEYGKIKLRLSQEVRDATIVNLTPEVIQTGIEVVETVPVRTMDALHVASAMAWGTDLFVSSDDRQVVASRTMGLKTKQV